MNTKSKLARLGLLSAMMLAMLLGAAGATAQDELRRTFFQEADAALLAADAANAELLSPKNYTRATAAYTAGDTGLARGRNIDYVREKTADAEKYYKAALRSAKLARTVLGQVLKSRQDGINAGAPKLSTKIWDKAQKKFTSAVRYLERGSLKDAKELNIEATILFRDAELVAIKAQYLDETRRLIAEADRAKVGRYAPLTLDKAQRLLAEAETELSNNRYDADRPRSLAKQANYEAKHAVYLSTVVRSVKDRKISVEQLVLQWEEPLHEVASAADIPPAMSNGPSQLQEDLVGFIENVRNMNQSLHQENEASVIRLADMEKEMKSLDEQLGGATAERKALAQRLEAQARIKEQFDKMEKMFAKSEARVFREGNNVILRLVGLTFDSGKSELRRDTFNLLKKAKKAVDLFPKSELVIEGHTDSYGGDDSNQVLSQDRAVAVQNHMIKTMRIAADRVVATGFGETKPVANNETTSGREKNRRIDIVIKPNLGLAKKDELALVE